MTDSGAPRSTVSPAISIRRAEISDAAAIARTMGARRAMAGTLQLPFPSVEAWRKRLADHPDERRVLVAEVEGEVVGNAGIHPVGPSPRRRHAMALGMSVHDDWQGRGVGSALLAALIDLADNWLGVVRLELTVYTDNERAVALYRRFGFEVEGTLRRYALRDGQFVDAYAMARLRPAPAVTPGTAGERRE